MRLRIDKLAGYTAAIISLLIASVLVFLIFARTDQTITVYGRIEPDELCYIRLSKSGVIERVYVRDGALVAKGDTILSITNPDEKLNRQKLALDLELAKNELQQLHCSLEILNRGSLETQVRREILPEAETRLQQAKKKLITAQSLFKKGYISSDEYECIRTDYELCAASYEMSQKEIATKKRLIRNQIEAKHHGLSLITAQLDWLNESISSSAVLSPTDGHVRFHLHEELWAGPLQQGKLVATISNLCKLSFVAQVQERHIPLIREGQKARVSVAAYPESRHRFSWGKVVALKPTLDRSGFEIVISNLSPIKGGPLFPGLTGRAKVVQITNRRLIEQIFAFNEPKGGH